MIENIFFCLSQESSDTPGIAKEFQSDVFGSTSDSNDVTSRSQRILGAISEDCTAVQDVMDALHIPTLDELFFESNDAIRFGLVSVVVKGELGEAHFRSLSADFQTNKWPVEGSNPFSTSQFSRFCFAQFGKSTATIKTALQTAEVEMDYSLFSYLFEEQDAENMELVCVQALLHVFAFTTLGCEQSDPNLAHWEFHDVLSHTSSRLGRGKNGKGATFRFGTKSPVDAVRVKEPDQVEFPLTCSEALYQRAASRGLLEVINGRASRRIHSGLPISVASLATFLKVVFGATGYHRDGINDFVRRPYPSGGGLYENEVYVAVNRCSGLARGLYWYDSSRGTLVPISGPSTDFDGLFRDAFRASGNQCWPQVLLVFSSRFSRMAYKYEGMAYTTQLKHIGVIYAHCYLVAEAMELAGCGFGLGDSSRFARVTGNSFFSEGSIGEFAIGLPSASGK